MLVDLLKIAPNFTVSDGPLLSDFALPPDVVAALNAQLNEKGFKVGRYTSSLNRDKIAVFPNQYFAYAAGLHSFAMELGKYFDIFEKIRLLPLQPLVAGAEEIRKQIDARKDFKYLFDNSDDVELFARFIDKDNGAYRFEGKRLINNEGKPRGSADCFGSVILKNINLPDASSGVFGHLVYELYCIPSVYSSLLPIFNNHISEQQEKTEEVLDKKFGTNIAETVLPKPFILLAGISGTGKTRFVEKQAQVSAVKDERNYCLVPVRPDWHEPSDLLGYVSRIGAEKYVPTDFLRFLVQAWKEIFKTGGDLHSVKANTCPYWLCLDEMNLAPVEQYFADYLSVLETREWKDGVYKSQPLLSEQLDLVRYALGGSEDDPVWKAFSAAKGIPLPPNLIVAGTVNMDETTHGFSRKVIDRALTIDFQEFFPNDFNVFFEGQAEPKTLTFPIQSEVKKEQLGSFDRGDLNVTSMKFLKLVNIIMKGTPFELAYRALNELFLSEVSFKPETAEQFQAVWDDYLMQKILPRIEGDAAKLRSINSSIDDEVDSKYLKDNEKILGKGSVLHALYDLLEKDLLKDIWAGEKRPDLLRDTTASIPCRSRLKIEWMMRRLKVNHFTDFWV